MQVGMVGNQGMLGIPFFEFKVVRKRLDDRIRGFHKNGNSCKVVNFAAIPIM